MKKVLLTIAACALSLTAMAQSSAEDRALEMLRADSLASTRLVTRATLYGIGYTNVYDTYLSPQEYTGIEGRVAHESLRAVNWFSRKKKATATPETPTSTPSDNPGAGLPKKSAPVVAPAVNYPLSIVHCPAGAWVRQSYFEGNVGYTHNRADNNNTLSALVHWTFGLLHPWQVAPGLHLLAGGATDLNGGFVYNMRNGNNPAQARAYFNLCATGMAVYDTRLLRRPLSLRYQLTLPVAGLMFSPHYGQSYYEIFAVGNTAGIVNFTSLHNQPSLRQMLTADISLRRLTLRLAYVCDIQQSRLHQIETHTYSHAFMIGFVRQLYLIPPRR